MKKLFQKISVAWDMLTKDNVLVFVTKRKSDRVGGFTQVRSDGEYTAAFLLFVYLQLERLCDELLELDFRELVEKHVYNSEGDASETVAEDGEEESGTKE